MSLRNPLVPSCNGAHEGRPRRRAATWLSELRCVTSLALALCTPGCLVTSTPDFSPPKRSTPILIPSTADPDPRSVFIVEKTQFDQEQSFYFRAHVLPGNNDDVVHFKLYIDYGFNNPDNRLPYWGPTALGLPALDPSTSADAGQPTVEARWDPKSYSSGAGCHNVTLMASHEFDEFTGCPICMNDSSQITWQVYLCDQEPCKTDFTLCQGWKQSCRDANPNQCGASP